MIDIVAVTERGHVAPVGLPIAILARARREDQEGAKRTGAHAVSLSSPCRQTLLEKAGIARDAGWMLNDEDDAWRHSNIGRLLNNATRRFEARVFELLAEAGHNEVRITQLSLTRNLDRSGTGITELARRAATTKQGMSELVRRCEAQGLVKVEADPLDARAKIVMYTDRGRAWLDAFHQALIGAENEMCAEIGEETMSAIAEALMRYGSACHQLRR